jgi:hypothetical protein
MARATASVGALLLFVAVALATDCIYKGKRGTCMTWDEMGSDW